ncbi:hypothetical protein RCH08_003964 [Janthinobacterium sp. CG_S6]|nr:hypothetical protein [Janthinobacterium sp. CG_S6]
MQNTQNQAEAAQAHDPKTMLKGWKIPNLGGLGCTCQPRRVYW